jgi:phosphatidylinositol alpha-1,6-mannosyltransferase
MAAQGLTGKKILLTVGNLVARKGHDMVLKALPEVIKHTRNIGYIITGKGPQYNHLQQLVRIHQLQQYVKFMPQITHHELHKLYRACDIFIMPTRTLKNKQGQPTDVEGFGIVFVEANLYAKPVIGGDSGGVPEAIKNGFSGLTVNSEDSATIAKAIIKLLTDDPLAKRLGQQGRERALEKFDWHKESKKLIKILNG